MYDVNAARVRDHCYITRKYRVSPRQSCNVNSRLTNKIPVIFHNLKRYDGDHIMQEIDKFDQDINIIPNGVEIYMPFLIGKKLYWRYTI